MIAIHDMPEFQSKYFGKIAYDESAVIHFPQGLPGFGEERRFLLIEQPVNKPIVFLQSLCQPGICFITLPVTAICQDYEPAIAAEDLRSLGLPEDHQPVIGAEVHCLAVVSLAEERPPAANLLAPVVINWKTRLAVQAIQVDSGYSHEHPLFAEATVGSCS